MLDIKRLLQPISEAAPCGEDMSFSSELDAIAKARQFDDPTLEQGEWVTELKEADWDFVVKSCTDLLANQSKDLRLAVWLAEANAKVNRFRGLGDAYMLMAGLLDQFWDDLYPLADEDGYEQRIGNLHWLLSRSVQLVREIPITEGRVAYSIMQLEAARANANNPDRQNNAQGNNPDAALKLSDIETARKRSSRSFYENLLQDVRYCATALADLDNAADAWLGTDGPGFSAAKEALDNVIHTILPFARDIGVQTDASSELPSQEADDAAPAGVQQLPQSAQLTTAPQANAQFLGQIQTRTQALAQLRLVADFFRRTEPHSPVIYLAEKAADWGDLPLHEWLRTVVKDQGSLSHIEEMLGIKEANG